MLIAYLDKIDTQPLIDTLLKLAAITGRVEFKAAAEKSLRLFADRLHSLPQAVPHLLLALAFWLEEPRRVVLAGDLTTPAARELLRAAHGLYQPGKVVLGTAGPVESLARTLAAPDGQPTAYVCTGAACQPPTREAAQLREWLRRGPD